MPRGTIQLLDFESGRMVGLPLQGHTGAVRSVAFSKDGARVLVAQSDGMVRIYDRDPLPAHAVPSAPKAIPWAPCVQASVHWPPRSAATL